MPAPSTLPERANIIPAPRADPAVAANQRDDTTVAAESPETTPAKWDKVEFPKILRESVAREAHYRYLVKDGASIEALGRAGADANGALIQEMHKIVGQQSQANR